MIHADLRDKVAESHLRLPDLVVLTELKTPRMWFPVALQGRKDAMGYLYRLDGRELLVIRHGLGASVTYRISETEVLEIEEPIMFNVE